MQPHLCHESLHNKLLNTIVQAAASSQVWRRERTWPLVAVFRMMRAASVLPGSSAAFEADLALPSLALLRDCRVTAGPGLPARCLLPHAALIEVAAEAVHTLADSPAEKPAVLTRMSLQAPAELPDSALDSRLLCTVDYTSGNIEAVRNAKALLLCQHAPCLPAAAAAPALKRQHLIPAIAMPRLATAAECALQRFAVGAVGPTASGFLAHPAATDAAMLLQTAVSMPEVSRSAACTAPAGCAALLIRNDWAPGCGQMVSSSAGLASRRQQCLDVRCLSDSALTASCAFSGLLLVPRKPPLEHTLLPPSSPALHLLWQPIAAGSAQTPQQVTAQQWLILSTRPCSLEQLCSRVDIAVKAVNVVYGSAMHAGVHQESDMAVSSEAELQLLLQKADADHCFLVHTAEAHTASEHSTAVAQVLWALRAYRRSGLRAKLSLVTWDIHAVGPHEAAAHTASQMAAIGALIFIMHVAGCSIPDLPILVQAQASSQQ